MTNNFYACKKVGAIAENIVANYLIKNGCKIIYDLTDVNNEQDFVIEKKNGERYNLEVKGMNQISTQGNILIEYNGWYHKRLNSLRTAIKVIANKEGNWIIDYTLPIYYIFVEDNIGYVAKWNQHFIETIEKYKDNYFITKENHKMVKVPMYELIDFKVILGGDNNG